MYDELTQVDIDKMQAELDERTRILMPQLIEQVKVARAFGDLSENFEYKAAKQDQNKNRSRIRYLERMIATAKVLKDTSKADEVGLFDKVTVWFEEDEMEDVYQIVSTVKVDVLSNRISNVSPMGKALLGRKAGERLQITAENGSSYTVIIRSIEKQDSDSNISLNEY
jgi:transcription elongation factor GreA